MTDNPKEPLKSEESEDPKKDAEGVKDEDGQMVPKSRMDKVIEQREDFKAKYEENTEKLTSLEDTVKELQEKIDKKEENKSDAFTREEEDALSKIDRGLKQRGYLTKAELEELRSIDARNNEINRLQGKYHKGSGYPEFKTDEIMVYAAKKGFGNNLEAAYRDMHWEDITQIIAQKKGEGLEPPDSEKPTGADRPKQTELTGEQVKEMTPAEWNEKGPSIMEKFKRSVFGR
jgi:vacuolar-type H+-ATPase subunit I/STV1